MSELPKENGKTVEGDKYPLVDVRGLLLPSPLVLLTELDKVLDMKPKDNDIFIVTYPKCGTTWTQFLVWEIMNKGAPPPSPNQIIFNEFPFIEFTELEFLENLTSPRVMKSHLSFSLQPYNPSAKYIYVVRSPWDCCVSYFHHHTFDPSMPTLSFDKYFDLFIEGQVGWGDFFDHVLSWFKRRNDSNVLFLTYEDMKHDTRKALLKIAKFLGDTYFNDLQNEEAVKNCLKHSDFKYLKNLGFFFVKSEGNVQRDRDQIKGVVKHMREVDRSKADPERFFEVDFFRKGQIGDWKNHFSQTHIKRFNEYMIRKLANTEMSNFWQPLVEETFL